MAGRVNVDYDIEEVLAFCENAAQPHKVST